MAEFRINETCIIGNPACGYGFESSRLCFLARPADDDFQMEEDLLGGILEDRNYELYAALQQIDPAKFAFCKKVCAKIIQAHFCIVLLNQSKHREDPGVRIPNPNVHFEYGMMLSFGKHVIPMQMEEESLAFNIYPLDTVKYNRGNFKTKAEEAIEDAIVRFETKEPMGRPIGAGSDVIKFLNFNGMQFSDITYDPGRTVYQVGASLGFNLLFDSSGFVFFGFFGEEEPREIVARVRLLLRNIDSSYSHYTSRGDSNQREQAVSIFAGLRILVLVPKNAPETTMEVSIAERQAADHPVPVELLRLSKIETYLEDQYSQIDLGSES